MMGVQYKIVYKKGTTNSAADALSEMPHNDSHVLALSATTPLRFQEILHSYDNDSKAHELLQ